VHETFTPVRVRRYTVANCLVITPMTRSRARPDGTPGDLAAEYYAQRASVGLIVTQGAQPSDDGQGYLATQGSYTPAYIAGRKNVTAAVHNMAGRIFGSAGGGRQHRHQHPGELRGGCARHCDRRRRARGRPAAQASPRRACWGAETSFGLKICTRLLPGSGRQARSTSPSVTRDAFPL
jgi:2,4-dienoyl-CoA reductase-like NADH-dependent reductase (Old Yellow Enzyme family)